MVGVRSFPRRNSHAYLPLTQASMQVNGISFANNPPSSALDLGGVYIFTATSFKVI